MKFEVSARQFIGDRTSQQDAWKIVDKNGANLDSSAGKEPGLVEDGAVLLLADGVGGVSGGEIASKTACDAFTKAFRGATEVKLTDKLKTALRAADKDVKNAQQRHPESSEMATTLVAVALGKASMSFVSVGDSLLLRVRDGELHYVNTSHSASEIADRRASDGGNVADWVEAWQDRRRNAITLALGAQLNNPGSSHTAEIATRALLPDDILILASDGLETLQFSQIRNIVRHLAPRGVDAIADGLMTAVIGTAQARAAGAHAGSQDNTTVVVARARSGASITSVLLEQGTPVQWGSMMVGSAVLGGLASLLLGFYFLGLGPFARSPNQPTPAVAVSPNGPNAGTPDAGTALSPPVGGPALPTPPATWSPLVGGPAPPTPPPTWQPPVGGPAPSLSPEPPTSHPAGGGGRTDDTLRGGIKPLYSNRPPR